MFGKELVGTEGMTAAHGSFLARMQTLREKADYDYGVVDADCDRLLADTEELLERVRRAL